LFEPIFIRRSRQRIVEKANCPVLIVPYQIPFRGFKKISFATDLTHSGADILNCLYGLTKYFDSEILVTHVAGQNSLDMGGQLMVKQFFDREPGSQKQQCYRWP
jgi:hypothetical protein